MTKSVRGCLHGLLMMGILATSSPAEETPVRPKVRRVFTQTSEEFPIEVRGPDASSLADLLKFAEASHRVFLERTGLKSLENFKLILEADASSPKEELRCFDSFPRKVRRSGDENTFRILVNGTVAKVREPVYRSCMICYLQQLQFKDGNFDAGHEMSEPPFWLSEGLTQIALKTREDTHAEIVRRYQRLGRMPELKTIQGWEQASDYEIEAYWQQSFASALVQLTTGLASEKQALVLWLTTSRTGAPGLFLEPTQRNEAWWRSSVATFKSSFTYYDWDKTVASLNEALQVGLTARGETERRALSIAALPDLSQVVSAEPVNSKVEELTLLRECAHPMWVPVVEQYRIATIAWLKSDRRTYAEAVSRASGIEKNMGQYMEQVRDYLDYVTVNYPLDNRESAYISYRDMVEALQNSRVCLRSPPPPASTGSE